RPPPVTDQREHEAARVTMGKKDTATTAQELPVRMLHDRVLVSLEKEGDRRSGGGILIPATASVGKRLGWAQVVAIGQHVRQVQVNDRVLFDPDESAEVELHGAQYQLLRERDIHAVAAPRVDDGQTGLYL
ncbi:MAG TPA: co-chaperone GroES, partial [Angustibacter sp.]|nr:co-chaperone GroES [Angustibacter sp.]